ncbi:MAG: hypothetical protein K6B43_04530 [Treponema sp.]|nr:hypothetical protein [Treponema sp.]
MENQNEKPKYSGYGYHGGGRKMIYEGGRQQLAISCSKAQKEAIQKAAADAGKTTAAYVLEKLGVAELK